MLRSEMYHVHGKLRNGDANLRSFLRLNTVEYRIRLVAVELKRYHYDLNCTTINRNTRQRSGKKGRHCIQ